MPKLLRLALHVRLTVALALCLAIGLTGQWALQAQQAVHEADTQAQANLRALVNVLAPRLAALERSGQGASVPMVLQQAMHAQTLAGRAVWRKTHSEQLEVLAQAVPSEAPDWLVQQLKADSVSSSMQGVTDSRAAPENRVANGQLQVWPNRQALADHLWKIWRSQWLNNAALWLLLVLLVYALLRYALSGLQVMAQASSALLIKPETRVPVRGAYEIQRLAKAFNAMAAIMQKTRAVAKARVEQTTWSANHDGLTGLPNRTLLMDRITQALHHCTRQHDAVALAHINLDHFKVLNEQHGHSVGDDVLKTVAQRIGDQMREGDTLARVGSDDFVLLLTGLRQASIATQVLARVLKLLSEPIVLESRQIRVTASAGLALQEPVERSSGATPLEADQLLRQADQMMVLARQSGRGQFKVWQGDQVSADSIEQQWANRLIAGIHNDELVLHYQPKVDMRSGQLIGLEALVRWQHPSRGLLMPGAFLPFVEHTEAIVQVGIWTMQQAMRQMRDWHGAGHHWPVSVNIPARQFTQSGFVDSVKELLQQFPSVQPGHLTLEILETSSMDNLDQVRQTVETIQSLGVHCSLDDFGTGYSSLTYLKQLPAHEIKIDQSFVRGMLDDNGDLALVEGIITLAKVFSRKLVAEGVETLEHGALLYRLGCPVLQGWVISKPMPAEEVPGWQRQYQPAQLWRDWSACRWNLSHFPVLVASYDLRAWLSRLSQVLEGQSAVTSLHAGKNYLDSRLGAWYQRLGRQQFGHHPQVQALDELHQQMHARAVLVLKAFQAGQAEQAQRELQALHDQAQTLMQGLGVLQEMVLGDTTQNSTRF